MQLNVKPAVIVIVYANTVCYTCCWRRTQKCLASTSSSASSTSTPTANISCTTSSLRVSGKFPVRITSCFVRVLNPNFLFWFREKARFSLKGPEHRNKRFRIYRFLLEHFTDTQRFNITNKINQTVLGEQQSICAAFSGLCLQEKIASFFSLSQHALQMKSFL